MLLKNIYIHYNTLFEYINLFLIKHKIKILAFNFKILNFNLIKLSVLNIDIKK